VIWFDWKAAYMWHVTTIGVRFQFF